MTARRVIRVRVRGRVQGVGYRAFVAREAEARALAGFVRNRSDGSVEALVAGATDDLDALLRALRKGPMFARVDDLAVEDAGEADLRDEDATHAFSVRETI